MKYLVETKSSFLFQDFLETLLSNELKDYQVLHFDFENLMQGINEFLTTSLFDEPKIIVVRNCVFETIIKDKNLSKLIEASIKSNNENCLVFQVDKILKPTLKALDFEDDLKYVLLSVPKDSELISYITK